MRVELRVTELLGDQLLEALREDVLEHLGLRVDLVPAHAQVLDEEELEQAVMADHLECDQPAALGQVDPVVALVLDQAEYRELPQHPGDRSRPHVEALGERGRRDRAVARLQRIDRFRVVLHGSG